MSPTSGIDPRGQRVAAALTVVVLAVALVASPSGLTVALLLGQFLVFLLGATLGPARTPYAWVFRTVLRPRLGPPRGTEDPRPPRFAQAVGLGFTVLALGAYAAGAELLGAGATGAALAAAFLNAAFGLCLGCELYLLGRRVTARPRPA